MRKCNGRFYHSRAASESFAYAHELALVRMVFEMEALLAGHLQHGLVLAQHVAPHLGDAARPAALDEPRKEQVADAVALHVAANRKRELAAAALVEGEAGDTEQPVILGRGDGGERDLALRIGMRQAVEERRA